MVQTIILLAIVLVAFVFALRHAARVFGGKDGCHGGEGCSSENHACASKKDADEGRP